MAYRIFKNSRTNQYEIEECKSGITTFDTIEQAQSNIDRLVERDAQWANRPESDLDNAIHGIPSEKSLKTLNVKLAAMKRAEEIENGSEEL